MSEVSEDVTTTPQRPKLPLPKGTDEQAVIDFYMAGNNYYQVAHEFYGFESDEAVVTVRDVIERAEEAGKLAGEPEPEGPSEVDKLREQLAAAEKARVDAEAAADEAAKEKAAAEKRATDAEKKAAEAIKVAKQQNSGQGQ